MALSWLLPGALYVARRKGERNWDTLSLVHGEDRESFNKDGPVGVPGRMARVRFELTTKGL